MQTVRLPLLRGALFLIALAAIAFILARGDSPAQATTYNPNLSIKVSDANPGAVADIEINFSVDVPDSFPNVKTHSSIQFLPTGWGIHKDAPVGGLAGTFNALTNLGLFGTTACLFPIPVPFTMIDASVDTSNTTMALDVGGDLHPGGPGFSGQFAPDPDTIAPPTDLNLPLINFNPDEKYTYAGIGRIGIGEDAYRDADGSNNVSVRDVRLTDYNEGPANTIVYPAGTVVQLGDADLTDWFGGSRPLANFPSLDGNEKHSEVVVNSQMDPGENMYRDVNRDGKVSYGDIRLFWFGQLGWGSIVQLFQLPGGVYRYPDFLNQMIPPSVVGDPLARQFAIKDVLGTPVSLNIVTYHPGQLPGYPETLGYPNVVVLLNPVAPVEAISINQTSDLCAPLSLTSTNFGVSKDNPSTAANEDGYVRLTNPRAEKGHTFTLVTTSQPDADNDGIENMLDTCPFDPNSAEDPDGKGAGVNMGAGADNDALDAACDPYPNDPSLGQGISYFNTPDQDVDSYGNRADNCAVAPNGIQVIGQDSKLVPGFYFVWAITGDPIGPSNQIDTDGDDIGDACEGSEHGSQCADAEDNDADGAVNDGCPRGGDTGVEQGDQCANAVDDDGDGKINDGCPAVTNEERGDQCLNNLDDDGLGVDDSGGAGTGSYVNDGCPAVGAPETRISFACFDALDNDGDGYINDGCPAVPAFPWEFSSLCNDARDNDGDGKVNDGCPPVFSLGTVETGAQCDNTVDDDADGIANDGCPAVDPGDVAKTTITGHMHVRTLTQDVSIVQHGIALKDLNGKSKLNNGGSAEYAVIVNNTARSPEDIPVALKVEGGCGAVDGVAGQNTQTVRVNGNSSKAVKFTVDFTGCLGGEYIVRADACHAGDPTGLFGSSPCPGASDVPQPAPTLQSPSGVTASWETDDFYGFNFLAKNAIDNISSTSWCQSSYFGGPEAWIQASFSSPLSVDRVDIENSEFSAYGWSFGTGTLTFSNGFSQPVTLDVNGEGSFSVSPPPGVTWVRFTGPVPDSGFGCMSEFKTFGFIPVAGDPDPLDDAPIAQSVDVGTP